jgi:hypothetical protein
MLIIGLDYVNIGPRYRQYHSSMRTTNAVELSSRLFVMFQKHSVKFNPQLAETKSDQPLRPV